MTPQVGARPATVFALFLLVYMSTWAGHYASGDGMVKLAWATALVEHQTADIDPGPAVVYSKYGIGHSLVAIPAVALAKALEDVGVTSMQAPLYMAIFAVNGALWLALAALYLRDRYPAPQVWMSLALMGLGTIWWPYTKLDFSEPLVATCLLAGFVLVKRAWPAAGLGVASFAGLVKPEAFLLVAILVVWWLASLRPRGRDRLAILAIVPAVLVHLAAALVRGATWTGGYAGEYFSTPMLVGLYGLLFSAGKSVFLFSPALLLAMVAAPRFARTPEARLDVFFFAAVFISQLLLYAAWWDWSGDDAWGPRFMIPGTMLMCLPVVALASARLLSSWVLAAGVAVQLLAVIPAPLEYVLLVRAQTMERRQLFAGGSARLDFEDVRFNPRYSQIAAHWVLLRHILGMPPSADVSDAHRSGTPLPAMLPAEQWERSARVDILWVRMLADRVRP